MNKTEKVIVACTAAITLAIAVSSLFLFLALRELSDEVAEPRREAQRERLAESQEELRRMRTEAEARKP